MNKIIKINDNIHEINVPFSNVFTSVFTVKTPTGVVLFDTATYDEDVEGYILPMLDTLGIAKDDLKYIFISHNHGDHSGGLKKLMEFFPETKVIAGSDTIKIQNPDFDVIVANDGDVLADVLKIISIPGHSDDSIALLDTRTNTFITGDCLQVYGLFGAEKWGTNIVMPVEHLEAIEKVRNLTIDEIYMAHDYYPTGFKAIGKAEISRLLDECIVPLMKIKKLIIENPDKDSVEIQTIYNSEKVPPIITPIIDAMRKAINENRI